MNNSCATMLSLATSRPLKFSLLFNIILAAIGSLVFFWASVALWTTRHAKRFHQNLRLIVQMHLIGFFLHCVGRVVLHGLDLYNYTFLEPCQMIPSIYRCFIFRFMYNAGMWITTCSAIPLIIERWIATGLRDRYENRYRWIGYLLMFLQPILAAIPLVSAYSNLKFDGVFMPYCSVYNPDNPKTANIISSLAIAFQIIARIAFEVLFRRNKKLRADMQTSDLSTRYQLEQNKKSMQCLKIYANMSTLFLFLQFGTFFVLLKFAQEISWEMYLALVEMNCAFPTYGIVTVCLVVRTIKKVQNQINSTLDSQMKLNADEIFFKTFNRQIGTAVPNRSGARN